MVDMEEADIQPTNKKSKWYVIVPIIIAVVFAAILFYFDSKKNSPENNQNPNVIPISDYNPKPITPAENPRRNESLIAGIGCAGPEDLKTETLKQPDAIWEIKKSGEVTTVSLGKYRLYAPEKKIFDIPKFWLYFYSEKLGREDDGLYGLESSYVSNIRLIVNGYEQKLNLGGDEYMFIEIDYPLGDLYPYDKAANLEYEILVDLKCKNVKDGECLGNNGKSLDFLNDMGVIPSLRTFAVGCQEFNSGELEKGDLEVSAKFKY
jgi:hypothetical protein